MEIKRGEIVLADLEPIKGREQGGVRPCLIIQNDTSNENSPITIIAPITSRTYGKNYPTNIFLPKQNSKLNQDSTILLNQIRAIDKSRIINKLYPINYNLMKQVDIALRISLGLD